MSDKNNSDEEKESKSPSASNLQQRNYSLSEDRIGNSPEKKRTRPNPPGTPTKSIPIKNSSISNSTNDVLDGKFPLWVAGQNYFNFLCVWSFILITKCF